MEKDEQKKKEEDVKKSEDEGNKKPTENLNNGISPLEEARKVLEETKKTAKLITEEREKIEKLQADSLINGNLFAGQAPIKKTEDEEYAEDAKIRYEGTGDNPLPDDSPTVFK